MIRIRYDPTVGTAGGGAAGAFAGGAVDIFGGEVVGAIAGGAGGQEFGNFLYGLIPQ